MSIPEIREWVEVNKKLITLGALFFLVSSISFALGYLSAGELKHPQIVIEQNKTELVATASIIEQVKPVKKEPLVPAPVVSLPPPPIVEPTPPPIIEPIIVAPAQPPPEPVSQPTPPPPAPVQPDSKPSSTCRVDQVNINTASKEQLDMIIHVGPAIADRIIAARPFKSLEELDTKVSGIGPKYTADIIAQDKACVL